MHEGGFERWIFEKVFHGNFILNLEFLLEICWEEDTEEMFFLFHTVEDVGPKVWNKA